MPDLGLAERACSGGGGELCAALLLAGSAEGLLAGRECQQHRFGLAGDPYGGEAGGADAP